MSNQEDLDEINPLTESVAFDTLLQDESLSEDVREIMRMKWHARHVHKSYQRISILTLNFNTSFVGRLANVATLEYFTLTVFFSDIVERCSRVWFGCIERYTWLAVLTRTHVFLGSRYVFFWTPAETLVSLVSLLSGRQRWKSAEHVAPSISVFLFPFHSACLSQCFWSDAERMSMSLRKC